MTSRQAQFQEDTYFRVMKLVQAQPNISQRQLAQTLGLSLGGVNYCLQALIQKGWVKAHNFSSNPNKLSYAYLLTPTGITEKTALTSRFLKRKLREYTELRAEIKALQQEVSQPDKHTCPPRPSPLSFFAAPLDTTASSLCTVGRGLSARANSLHTAERIDVDAPQSVTNHAA